MITRIKCYLTSKNVKPIGEKSKMSTRVGIAEFLNKVSKLKNESDKINALKFNDSFVIRTILQATFDPLVIWLLPVGKTVYKPSVLVDQENILIAEIRKIKLFIAGFYDNLTPTKRELLFIEFLETLAPADAKMIVDIKNGENPWGDLLNRKIVLQAYPDLFVEPPEPEPEPEIEPVVKTNSTPVAKPAARPSSKPASKPAPISANKSKTNEKK